MGVTSLFLNASGGIPNDAPDEAMEMDVMSEEHEPPIHSLVVTQDEASMSTTMVIFLC